MNGRSPAVRQAYQAAQASGIMAMSAITAAEICYGIERRPEATRITAAFDALCLAIPVLAWDLAAARSYGRLRVQLSTKGKSLELEDMQIAAHAIAVGAVLATRDQDFAELAGLLQIENWATDI